MTPITCAIHVRATAQQTWDVFTNPQFASRIFPGPMARFDAWPGGSITWAAGDTVFADGKVLEIEPHRRLVHTFKFLAESGVDPQREKYCTWSFVLAENGGITAVQLAITDFVDGSVMCRYLEQGVPFILSSAKSLLETGRSLSE